MNGVDEAQGCETVDLQILDQIVHALVALVVAAPSIVLPVVHALVAVGNVVTEAGNGVCYDGVYAAVVGRVVAGTAVLVDWNH